MSLRLALTAAAVALAALPVMAQDTPTAPVGTTVQYPLQLGPLTGAAPDRHAAAIVRLPGAQWIRLHFAEAKLPGDSKVTVISLLDGEHQRLDSAAMRMWSDSTAYFNGDAVSIDLDADPGAGVALLRITEVETSLQNGPRGGPGQCGICGADDRVSTAEDWAGRLLPVGCTASVFCVDSTLVSAGHCIQTGIVAQFRVPASGTSCQTVNPPVDDQFPITQTLSLNAGVGSDWSVLRCGTNSLGQRPFDRYGQFRPIATSLANVGNTVNLFAYGVDTNCPRSQTQQRSGGAITARLATSYQYNADIRGGCSGSALIVNDQIVGICTHCMVNCPNHGTRVDRSDFAAARNTLGTCDEPRTITVTSSGAASVPITVSPLDLDGIGDGNTNFVRAYLLGSTVTFTAPTTVSAHTFQRWTVNGADAPAGTVLTLLVTQAATATAVYGPALCPCNVNGDGVLNSQDFFDFMDSFFAGNADFNGNGTTDSQDFFDFLTCFFAGC